MHVITNATKYVYSSLFKYSENTKQNMGNTIFWTLLEGKFKNKQVPEAGMGPEMSCL